MKNYRLKKEAFKFFKEKLATQIQSLDYWERHGEEKLALEEVEDGYVSFGHQDRDKKGTSLNGWSQDNGSHFHFTINFPSMKYNEYDKFKDGKVIRELMNKIQDNVNYFLSDFVNEEQH